MILLLRAIQRLPEPTVHFMAGLFIGLVLGIALGWIPRRKS